MVAPLGFKWNYLRKSLMGTMQRCCVLFWTNPGGSTLQNCHYMASYLPSQTIQIRWARHAGESRTLINCAQTIMDAGYLDDIALLANTPAQAETLLHSLEWAADGIDLHVNAKMKYVCSDQRGDISTLKGGPLKLVDKFTYLESSVSSTETANNTRLANGWTAIGHMELRPER